MLTHLCDRLSVCVQVEFSVEKSTFHLLVDGFCVTDGQLTNDEGSSLDLHNPVYLGGDLHSKTTKVCIITRSLSFCHAFSNVFVYIQHDSGSEQKAGPSTSVSYSATQHSLYIGGEFIKHFTHCLSKDISLYKITESFSAFPLFRSGTTKYSRLPVPSPFVGCLRNVKINERPVAFETESRVVDPVIINRCPVY